MHLSLLQTAQRYYRFAQKAFGKIDDEVRRKGAETKINEIEKDI